MRAAADATPLLARLKALPGPVWVLAAGQLINKFGGFVLFFLIIYLTRLGYSPGQAGIAAGAYGVGGFVAMFVGGHAADRFGRRSTIVVSMVTSALAMVALSQVEGLGALTALAALAGLGAEMYRPAASALLADLTPAGDRVTAFAVYRTAINAGIAAGPAVAGLLAEKSFLWIFLGDAATSLAFGAVALLALPGGRPTADDARRATGGFLAAARDRHLQRVLVGMFLGVFCLFQIATTLPLHVESLGLSTATYGLLLSLNGLLVATLEIPATSIIVRLPARLAIGSGFLLIGAAMAGIGLATAVPLLAIMVCVATAGEILAMPAAGAFVADLAPAHLQGRYQGALGAAAAAGVAAAPALGGTLYGFHPTAAFLSFLLAGLTAFAIVLAPIPSPAPSPAPDPTP